MGHDKIQTTFDTYGHLFPGSRDEVRERMDGYLAKQRKDAEGAARRLGRGVDWRVFGDGQSAVTQTGGLWTDAV